MVHQSHLERLAHREIDDPLIGRTGLCAVDVHTGREVLSHRADEPFLMASLTKVLMAGAALELFGSEHTFATKIFADAVPDEGGIIRGDLYFVGGGDPTLGDDAHVEEVYGGRGTVLSGFSAALRALGVRRVEGNVIGVGSLFDTDGGFGGWYPALCLNRTKCEDPALAAAARLHTQLTDDAISVAGIALSSSRMPPSATELYSSHSPSIAELTRHAGHESDNFVSEVLTKSLASQTPEGPPYTSEVGLRQIENHASAHGVTFDLINGSGMRVPGPGRAVGNRASPRSIVDYLIAVRSASWFPDMLATLPEAGRQGTLTARMRNTVAPGRVRAKTGTLTRERKPLIDALAGYCETPRTTIAFAFIHSRSDSRYLARSSLDRLTEALVRYAS